MTSYEKEMLLILMRAREKWFLTATLLAELLEDVTGEQAGIERILTADHKAVGQMLLSYREEKRQLLPDKSGSL